MLNQISIGIRTFLRDGKLFHTLASIRRNLPECQIIVADDGEMTEEKDGVYADLEREGHIVIRMPFDSGFGAKSNAIVDHLVRPYLLIGSDDFDFSPPDVRMGIEKMLAILEKWLEFSIVGGRVDNQPYERLLFDYLDGSVKEIYIETNEPWEVHDVDLTKNYCLIRRNVFWSHANKRTAIGWDYNVKIGGGEHGAFFYDILKAGLKVGYVPGVNINAQEGSDSAQYNWYRRRACRPERECFERRGIKKYVLADGTVDYEDIIGKHIHLFAKPENFTPPTKSPDDCICGAKGDPKAGRTLIANCPCCEGVQILVEGLCDCDNPSYIKTRVVLPPNTTMRFRYIDTAEPIA